MSINTETADVSMFLDLDGFAEKIDVYPAGRATGAVVRTNVKAVVDRTHLIGSNEVRGDGLGKLNTERGRGIRESVVVEVATSESIPVDGKCLLAITLPGTTTKQYWSVKRRVGSDAGLSSYLAVKNEEQEIRKSERTG